jgi:hypothetical protein
VSPDATGRFCRKKRSALCGRAAERAWWPVCQSPGACASLQSGAGLFAWLARGSRSVPGTDESAADRVSEALPHSLLRSRWMSFGVARSVKEVEKFPVRRNLPLFACSFNLFSLFSFTVCHSYIFGTEDRVEDVGTQVSSKAIKGVAVS